MFKLLSSVRNGKKNLESMKDYEFCHLKMPDEDNKILKYIPGEKSLRVPFIIYADLEWLLRKINIRKNNPEISLQKRKLRIGLQAIL